MNLNQRPTLIFDLDMTLFRLSEPFGQRFGQIIDQHYIDEHKKIGTILTLSEAYTLRRADYVTHNQSYIGLKQRCPDANLGQLATELANELSVHFITSDVPCKSLRRTLLALRRSHYRLVVWSNSATPYVKKALAAINLLDCFYPGNLLGIDRLGWTPKPNPRSFWKVLEVLKLDPRYGVFIDDHEGNLLTPFNHGMQTYLALAPQNSFATSPHSKLLTKPYLAEIYPGSAELAKFLRAQFLQQPFTPTPWAKIAQRGGLAAAIHACRL